MGLKTILFSLELAISFNLINPANLDVPSFENIQDMILEEKFVESLILPTIIKEERTVLSPVLEPVLNPIKDVTFHLFTRSNPERGSAIKVGDLMGLKDSEFMPDRGLKMVVHGWTDKGTTKWLKIIRSNYLSEEDCNVIIVNWFPTSIKEYHVAAKLTEQIGAYVGEFLHFLNVATNISLADVHILGHSLGAHIAGFAGSSLSGDVGRITGLDPARPAFEAPVNKDQKSRLDPSDAIFVDVIHTCAGTLGFIKSVGHADFYPNGGTFPQPGCSPLVAPVMGNNASPESRGSFFLETNGEVPYGKGDSNSLR
ncbi:endothelial lipase-like isoform X2 [Diachasmimorpha longicaudata]|uniref:endothelial lipase-like isoform X2 n=1 Tax=Diachasmimorpha longicaudata TaxID=58733 RepID=UPI0030B87E33